MIGYEKTSFGKRKRKRKKKLNAVLGHASPFKHKSWRRY